MNGSRKQTVLAVISVFALMTVYFSTQPALAELIIPTGSVSATFYKSMTISPFTVGLAGVGAGDVGTGPYRAWSVQIGTDIVWPDYPSYGGQSTTYSANLYSTSNLPSPYNDNADLINWIINNSGSTPDPLNDMQLAIWNLAYGFSLAQTPTSQALIDSAKANGEGFIPGPGQLESVLLDVLDTYPTVEVMSFVIGVPVPSGPIVPIPNTILLLGTGVGSILLYRRRS